MEWSKTILSFDLVGRKSYNNVGQNHFYHDYQRNYPSTYSTFIAFLYI